MTECKVNSIQTNHFVPPSAEVGLIAERVRAGIRNARAKGKTLGRPRVAVDGARIAALRAQGHSWGTIHRETGIAKGTAQRAFYSLPQSVGLAR